MADMQLAATDSWQEILAQLIEQHRDELASSYHQVLRETLFNRRTTIRPNLLKGIASDEVDALKNFFGEPTSPAWEHGEKLYSKGLSEQTVLRLGGVTRQFLLVHLEAPHLAASLKAVDMYQESVILGYIQAQEKGILNEQELIRSALQRAVSRYMVEIREIEAMAHRASEANEFKTRFIARMGHELRTPVGAMMGMAEMLQQGVYGPLTTEQKKIAQRIIKKAEVLKQIFAELLDQSRIESGELRLKVEEFSPHELVEGIQASYLPMALQKGLSIQLKINPDLPATVIGDKVRIEQIVTNLVINAIKFTETGRIILAADANASHWQIEVKDTGIGIASEQLAYVFEPFRQIDETASRKYGGVGLGLAIVHQLVTAMDGTIEVKSRVGQGSTFCVSFPLQPAC